MIFLKKYKTKSPWFVPLQTLQTLQASERLIGHNVVSKKTLAVIDKVGPLRLSFGRIIEVVGCGATNLSGLQGKNIPRSPRGVEEQGQCALCNITGPSLSVVELQLGFSSSLDTSWPSSSPSPLREPIFW